MSTSVREKTPQSLFGRTMAVDLTAWMALFFLGLMFLYALIGLIRSNVKHDKIDSFLSLAQTRQQSGQLAQARIAILQALAEDETFAISQTVNRFGSALLDMPSLLPDLRESFAVIPGDEQEGTTAFRFSVIEGDNAHATEVGQALISSGEAGAEQLLWMARTKLEEGNLEAAQTYFKGYHFLADSDLPPTIELTGNATPLGADQATENIYELVYAGLFLNAYELGQSLLRMNIHHPSIDLVFGVHDDIYGDGKKAEAAYRRVLSEEPNNLLALRRLAYLARQNPEL
jgi:hypothetical protein